MKSPIVVAHLIATNFYGGPERQILSHALQLDAEHFRFILISFVERGVRNELVDMAREKGVTVAEIPVGNPFDPRLIKNLSDILSLHKVELLCAHGYKANVVGRLASWLRLIPLVAVSRGWTAENRRIRFYEKLDRVFLRFSQQIVAVSTGQEKKIVAHGISSRNLCVIRNAINLTQTPLVNAVSLRKQLGLSEQSILVASAGRLSPEKNYATMITVSKKIIQANDKVVFIIFGEGFLRSKLEQQIATEGLGGKFLLPGFRRDLPTLIPQIDIFMLPSFTEGLPNVVLEAFASKKPVVATAVGGTPEVVQDGISGFLTTPDNIRAMVQSVEKLVDSPGLRQQMGHAGYSYIAEHFGFEAQTHKYTELYKASVGGGR